MTLWEPIIHRTAQEAHQMRFGQLRVSLTFDVRDGQLVRVHPRYKQQQSISVEDLKSLDKRQELA